MNSDRRLPRVTTDTPMPKVKAPKGTKEVGPHELARAAYIAYGSVTDFKNYQGLAMPTWEELPFMIQEAWVSAVIRVKEICNGRI